MLRMERRFDEGDDVILETASDNDAGKPDRDHVFCSKHLPDGGATQPRLGPLRNCRQNTSCTEGTEAGVDRVEVQCGKEHVELAVVDGRTILRGPFGERLVAPHPMTIRATVREQRIAEVDC